MAYSIIQLRSFVSTVRAGFHVSRAAAALNTSQPVVSKHLIALEAALGRRLITRTGKRLTGLTEEGRRILPFAERVLRDHDSIHRIGQEAQRAEQESLTIATTPTMARYFIADTVRAFAEAHPRIQLCVRVLSSDKAVEEAHAARCDLTVVPAGITLPPELHATPLASWPRVLIGLPDCALFSVPELTLDQIASVPIVSFETPTFSMHDTFDQQGISPRIAVTASNPDVMKTYTALGLGVSVVARPAFDPVRDAPLVSRDVSRLFPNVNIIALSRSDCYQTRAHARFLDLLRAHAAEDGTAAAGSGAKRRPDLDP